ncbi:MAG: hypothetical protein RR334_00110 [Clostridia bacterium]
MSKKSILSLVIVTCLLMVSLVTYTIIVACVPQGTPNMQYVNSAVMLRVGDTYNISNATFDKETNNDTSILKKNEDGSYSASKDGVIKAVVRNGNTETTYTITVVTMGEGTEVSPINIVSPAHIEQLSKIDTTGKFYKIINSLDFEGIIWKPVAFKGTIYADKNVLIKNVKIIIDATNVLEYVDGENLNVGLFSITDGATIKDLVIEKMFINVSGIEDKYKVNVGGVVGFAKNTTIENVKIATEINAVPSETISSRTQATENQIYGIGGIAGVVKHSVINGVSVDAKFIATSGLVKTETGTTLEYGAIVGSDANGFDRLSPSSISNSIVTKFVVEAQRGSGLNIAGVIGTLYQGDILNVEVQNMSVVDPIDKSTNEFPVLVSGIAGYTSFISTITNVYTNGLSTKILAYVTGSVYSINRSVKLIDAKVKIIDISGAHIVAGLVDINLGTITYTNEFKGCTEGNFETVLADKMSAYFDVAGLIGINDGTFNGAVGAINRVSVNVKLLTTNIPKMKDFEIYAKTNSAYATCGLASSVNEGASISNIDVDVAIKSIYSMAGAVGNLKGKIQDINIKATMQTILEDKGEIKPFFADRIGGAVCSAQGNAEIVDVNVDVTANSDLTRANVVDAGGLVALVVETSEDKTAGKQVKISANAEKHATIKFNIYADKSRRISFDSGLNFTYVQSIGGIIGRVNSTPSYAEGPVNKLAISNYSVSGMFDSNLKSTEYFVEIYMGGLIGKYNIAKAGEGVSATITGCDVKDLAINYYKPTKTNATGKEAHAFIGDYLNSGFTDTLLGFNSEGKNIVITVKTVA